MIREAIEMLVAGRSLTMTEAAQVMDEIMTGQATPAQFGALVIALRLKGETSEEIAGMARVMREKALRVQVDDAVVDTCGTGGDAKGTFNISTTAAFVVAGAGARVAKHGNRAMTSRCGSADVLEALGVKIDLGPEGVRQCIQRVGVGFMFAQAFHPAMRFAAGPRREIGIRTIFNILGPLTNPAGARHQVLGVADERLGDKLVHACKLLGSQHVLIVHGQDGMDELAISGPSKVWELRDGSIQSYLVEPADLGLEQAPLDAIKGGTAQENAQMLRAVLNGEQGPRRDVVLLNAAAALVAADRAKSLPYALALAAESIDSGKALQKLESLVQVSQGQSG